MVHEQYMQRCLQLAAMGAGKVAPNPMVGAVLVYGDRIIGEGYHQQYGEAHAEVNCINNVSAADAKLISKSTLYVSLEPCAHFGKTPPCADLIISHKIPTVIIGCRDSFAAVDGKGIAKLKAANTNVSVGIMEKECLELNKRFFTFHEKQRPYIILKWAQSNNGKLASLNPRPTRSSGRASQGGTLDAAGFKRLLISNEISNRLVHKWRSEESAILVGTYTALLDDPALTTRLYPGKDPVRLVIDKELKLPGHLKLFDGSVRTILFNNSRQEETGDLVYYRLNENDNMLSQFLEALYKMELQSIIVEGGTRLLQSFIDVGLWDEARVITNTGLVIDKGLDAPVLDNFTRLDEQKLENDSISFFRNNY